MTGVSLGSTPITGVYVGSTLATGVYLGSTKIWPAASGVTFVGACTSASSAVAVSSLNLGLPAAAVAGDVVLANILSNADQTGVGAYSNSGPAGSIKFVADTPFQQPAPHPGVGSAYAVRLSATDITNGYVTFNFTNFPGASIRGVVFRGVSQTMLDVAAGVAASTASVANPFTFSAPGITTDTNGCTLVAMGAVDATVTTALTDPTGYTVGDVGNDINILQQFAYQQQASAGATGDVSMTFGPDSTISPQGWFAWLVALRPIAPAITLSATFPSSLHVGDTGSFDITATLIDGATGSPTITGSSLPDGMSIGTTTDNGDGTFTATVSYDLTTEQDVTATFSATGGSVAATALVHEFIVGVVDDFSVAGTIDNYTITEQGAAGGTGGVSGGNLVLAPAQNVVNSVAARRIGSGWHSVEVDVSSVSAPNGFGQFAICLGTGAIVAMNGGTKWTVTVLNNCYFIRVLSATTFWVEKEVGGVVTRLNPSDIAMPDITANPVNLKLTVSDAGSIEAFVNGTSAYSTTDTSVATDAMVAMVAAGRFTDNSGGIVSISKIILE